MFFNIKKIRTLTAVSLISVFTLTSCGGGNRESGASTDETLGIYTSFSAITAITKPIIVEGTDVTQLTEPNVEAHDFEPSAKDVASISNSDLFIYNGLDIEHYIGDLISSVESDTLFVDSSENVPYVLEEDHGIDPHIWLSFEHVKIQAENISKGLSSVDSTNANIYVENLNKFISDVENLEKQYDVYLNSKKGQSVVVLHPAYSYLFDKYEITQVAIQENHDVEPTISELKSVIDYINTNGVKYIIAPSDEMTKPLQAVLEETDAEVVVINNLENITGDITKDTYINIMSENLNFIKTVFN